MIAEGNFAGIIFDCDGTLVNSGDAHFRAFQTAAMVQGRVMERSWYNTRTGLDRRSTLEAFASEGAGAFDVSCAIRDSIAAFSDEIGHVSAISETVDLLQIIARSHPVSVVTNAERPVAEASLGAIGVLSLITHLVTVSDGLPPKPAPDLFLLAARRMGLPVDRILVFEDSPQGVQAGLAAGVDVVCIRSEC